MPMIDPKTLKKDFPILSTKLKTKKPLVYLDSAATSQKPKVVLDAIYNYYAHDNANVHRGIHELGDRATRAWTESRRVIADFFGADTQELVVVRNTTEALNLFSLSYLDKHLAKGGVVITSQMEHHSNFLPWMEMARKRKAQFKIIPVDKNGMLDLETFNAWINEYRGRVFLVAVSHVSNTLGTINPIEKIASRIRDEREKNHAMTPIFVVDGAQAAPHMPINFHKLGVDAYAVSAHKMLGPMGVGALLVRKELLANMDPVFLGGGMISEVYNDHFTFAEQIEDAFTSGTPDVAGVVGWSAACQYLAKLGMKQVFEHDRNLVEYTLKRMGEVKEIQVIGPTQGENTRCGSVAFIYKSVHAHDVAAVLASEGIAVRSGHHCTMPLHKNMGWAATTRASFNVYTSKEDIDVLIKSLAKVKKIFG